MSSKAETLAWQALYKCMVEDSSYHKHITACADRQKQEEERDDSNEVTLLKSPKRSTPDLRTEHIPNSEYWSILLFNHPIM